MTPAKHRALGRAPRDVLLVSLLAVGLSACALFGGEDATLVPQPRSEVVKHKEWFQDELTVAVAPQKAAAEPNAHPLEIAPGELRSVLTRLQVDSDAADEPIALIPDERLGALADGLAEGLGKAAPDQDVTFVLLSTRSTGGLFSSKRYATSARVFYKDGDLNFIFGEADKFYSEQINHRVNPITAGTRGTARDIGGRLLPAGGLAFADGRRDWVTAPLVGATPVATRAPAASPEPQRSAPTASPAPNPLATGEPGKAAPKPAANGESQEAAPEPAAGDTSQKSAASGEPQPRGVAQRKPAPTAQLRSDLEDRLLILEGLREKGLITDKDYERKKQDLLQALDL